MYFTYLIYHIYCYLILTSHFGLFYFPNCTLLLSHDLCQLLPHFHTVFYLLL